jgi:thiol-disulfide isomerase/thioredoxin
LGYPPVSLYPEVVAAVLSAHLSDPHLATHLTRAHVQPYADAHFDALGTGPVTDARASWLPGLAQTVVYNPLLVVAASADHALELPALLRTVEADAERLRLLLSDAVDAAPVRYPAREVELAEALDRVQRLSVLASAFHTVLDDLSPASLAALALSLRHSDEEVARLATHLAWTLSRSGDADLALAALDLMVTATDETQVPSDSLRRWYAQADPANGAARFDGLSEQRPPVRLPTIDVASALEATLTDAVNGQPFDLSRLRGKTVFVDFWTTWCGPCLVEIPALQAFSEEVAGRDDFVFVSVLSDETDGKADDPSRPDADAVIRVRGITYPVLLDTEEADLTAAFGVQSWPSKFIIRPDGQVEEITGFWRPVVDEVLAGGE